MFKSFTILACLITAWNSCLVAQPRVAVPGFLPSKSALHFANSFENVPHLTINVAGVEVPIGDAANGMCGGMVFASRDYFESGFPVPSTTVSPSGGPVYDYIVERLYDSFNLPGGPLRYLELMNPLLPDGETELSRLGLAPHGRSWVMIREEWPQIRADLDRGVVSALGLVRVLSYNPSDLGQNHQALAYGYTLDGDDLQIFVYDPNHPDNDDVVIALNISNPEGTTFIRYLANGIQDSADRTFCFFRTPYDYKTPPPGAIHVDLRAGCLLPSGQPACALGVGGPYPTVASGAAAATDGKNVLIRGGSYPERLEIRNACSLRAFRGTRAVIGR